MKRQTSVSWSGTVAPKTHPVKRLDLTVAMQLLEQQIPGITYQQDTTRSVLIALATAEEHEQIAAALREMQSAPEDVIDPVREKHASERDPQDQEGEIDRVGFDHRVRCRTSGSGCRP